MKNTIKVAILLMMVVAAIEANAVSVGVTPGTLGFKNMLRNGYAEDEVTVTINTEENTTAKAVARGAIKDWVNFSADFFSVSKASPYPLKIIIMPPSDVPNGDYSGTITIETSPLGTSVAEGSAGATVKAAVNVLASINIIDVVYERCTVKGFSIMNIEKGEPLEISAVILNNGNVRINPRITVDIWDQDRANKVDMLDYNDQEILPTTTGYIKIRANNSLGIGQYWAEIKAEECQASDVLTFDVMEPGSLSAMGLLRRIYNKPFAFIGDDVEIVATFINTGQKAVSAKFRGNIKLGSSIAKELESYPNEVPVGESTNFTMHFTPQKEGRYIISGRVIYDNKRSFEGSSVLTVTKREEENVWLYASYFVIALIIVFLLWKIRRTKKGRR